MTYDIVTTLVSGIQDRVANPLINTEVSLSMFTQVHHAAHSIRRAEKNKLIGVVPIDYAISSFRFNFLLPEVSYRK